MNLQKDYYSLLGVSRDATEREIKKSYYRLSFEHHPDKGGDGAIFKEISEAYSVLTSERRAEYDAKSRWGSSYDESSELLDYEFNNSAKFYDEAKFKDWVTQNQLNVIHYVDEGFDGKVTFGRWVTCKACGGDGKDTSSKIEIRDEEGRVVKLFEGSDGCDFCEGSGRNWKGDPCYFCGGKGKVGYTDCKTCSGQRRIMGSQKLSGIVFPEGERAHRVPSMGHHSKTEPGKVGDLWLVRRK